MGACVSVGVRVQRSDGVVRLVAPEYILEVRADPPRAVLADRDGRLWSHLSLLASIDRVDLRDESHAIGPPEVLGPDAAGTVVVRVRARTPAWDAKEVRLHCTDEEISVTATVRGTGTLATATLFGGRAVLGSGAGGEFWSSAEFRSVYSPAPADPVQVVRPAAASVSLGVVGDGWPGRVHGLFSPPPLYLAFGRAAAPSSPTEVPGGGWLGLGLRAAAEDAPVTEVRYRAVGAGFRIELEYDGHTHVAGEHTTPNLVLRRVVDPLAGLALHRARLVQHGVAPDVPAHPPARWWREPIFCGWGAQAALAPVPGATARHPRFLAELPPAVRPPGPVAQEMSRADVYDAALARLAAHGVVPGTIVVDDAWQASYGAGRVARDRWPDLRGWVARRHAEGQRVLLWWKAWDPAGVPVEECVTDPAGRRVAVDPGNPAYRARLARIVARLLGPDGVDADGFKVDFTQHSPSGALLHAWTDDHPDEPPVWGMAGLHRLLRTLYDAAKAAKPDALVVAHAAAPGFGDVCDMVRTNDVLERDVQGSLVPPAEQLRARVAVVRAALPHHLIDTDQWPMPDVAGWRAYVAAQAGLGVPALYYAEGMDRSDEALGAEELALVARTWAAYRAGLP